MVRLTSKGLTASKIWPPLFGEIERRWERRFGKDEISRLRKTLQAVAGKLDVELPHGLPGGWEGTWEFPPRVKRGKESLPLPTLLSQLLLTFRIEFDRESPAPLVYVRQHAAGAGREADPRGGDSAPDRRISGDQRHRMADQAVRGGYARSGREAAERWFACLHEA